MAYVISPKAVNNLVQFFNKYCKNCFGLTTIDDVIERAVELSYRASVLRALYDENGKLIGFNGKTDEKNNARAEGEKILKEFLRSNHPNNNLFSSIQNTWEAIKNVYKSQGITWYTYGNAQKWVSMAIKYFIIIGYCNNLINFDNPLADSVFPVDGIMIKNIFKEFNIDGVKPSWSKCDDKVEFIDYLNAVKPQINAKGKKVLEYEIETW